MKRLVLIVFAAVVAVNMVACQSEKEDVVHPNSTPPIGVNVALVAVDGGNNDLFDPATTGAIDIKKMLFKGNKIESGDKVTTKYLPYQGGNIVSLNLDGAPRDYGILRVDVAWGFGDVLQENKIVDWGNGVCDTLYVEIDRSEGIKKMKAQLFVNKKLVWDNSDGGLKLETLYIRRFE